MTFTTPAFLCFLVVVFFSYWSLPRKGQNWLILAASLFFYGWWDPRFLLLLFFNAGIDYIAALRIADTDNVSRRKLWLIISLASNLGVLGFFKYFNFFADSFYSISDSLGLESDPILLHIILPVGISFFTFQALSYTIDVYRGKMHPVRDPIAYFGFICFFPHMVAGPIQRATHLLVQFEQPRVWDEGKASDGARQMLWGFFKKMVIADNLAPIVNAAYQQPESVSGIQLLLATYCFAFQIYCDFSGYTDIAIGCARLFGFDMTRNFAYPYFSRSIPEFWRRWHISLSTWFREYLYIPLGGNRVAPLRQKWNVLIVFLASGLWHGANWTFVLWGFLHGLFFLLPVWRDHRAASTSRVATQNEVHEVSALAPLDEVPGGPRFLPTLRDFGAMFVTFQLAAFAWIFFRADSISDAFLIVQKIAISLQSGDFLNAAHYGDEAVFEGLALIVILCLIEWVQRRKAHPLQLPSWRRPARWAIYYAVALVILLYANLEYTPFIYFQF
jgi:D-alanyl-lipoteichoic acid acyltransferase DltB (MBOAT superfamily)